MRGKLFGRWACRRPCTSGIGVLALHLEHGNRSGIQIDILLMNFRTGIITHYKLRLRLPFFHLIARWRCRVRALTPQLLRLAMCQNKENVLYTYICVVYCVICERTACSRPFRGHFRQCELQAFLFPYAIHGTARTHKYSWAITTRWRYHINHWESVQNYFYTKLA